VWRIFNAIGAVDGVNRVYRAPVDYREESVAVYVNGIALEPSADNGFSLIPPGHFELAEAPNVGDHVQVGCAQK